MRVKGSAFETDLMLEVVKSSQDCQQVGLQS